MANLLDFLQNMADSFLRGPNLKSEPSSKVITGLPMQIASTAAEVEILE